MALVEFVGLAEEMQEALDSLGKGPKISFGAKWTNQKTGISLLPCEEGWMNDKTGKIFKIPSKLESKLESKIKKNKAISKDWIFDGKIL